MNSFIRMVFACGADSPQTQMLRPPIDLFNRKEGISSVSPFTLQGGPFFSTQAATNLTEQKLNKPASELNGREIRDTDYISVDMLTEHIRIGNSETTLRLNGEQYTLDFLALHRAIWLTPNDPRPAFSVPQQVSLLFTNAEGSFAQICIPVEIGGTAEEENRALRYWLNQDLGAPPGDITVNELLKVNADPVPFSMMQYCWQFNTGQPDRELRPYTLILLNASLKLQTASAPPWLLAPEVNRHFRFGMILHAMKQPLFHSVITHTNTQEMSVTERTREISREQMFSSDVQTTVAASLYSVKKKELVGRHSKDHDKGSNRVEGFVNPASVRGLQNVKCYPIDLATQVDDQGNIFVDQTTNRALSLDDVKEAGGKPVLSYEVSSEETKQAASLFSNIRILIFVILFSFLGLVFVIVVMLYILRGTTARASSVAGTPSVAPSP